MLWNMTPNACRLFLRRGLPCRVLAHSTSCLHTKNKRNWKYEHRKYTSPYRDVIRAKVILFAAQGLSNDVIATRLDTPRQIVSKWRKRFALMRLPGLEDQPRGGRPALFSPPRRRSSKGPRLCASASSGTPPPRA